MKASMSVKILILLENVQIKLKTKHPTDNMPETTLKTHLFFAYK